MEYFVEEAGKYGMVDDAPDFLLAKEAWTSVRNMRPINGVMRSMDSDRSITSPTTSDIIQYIYPVRTPSQVHWFCGGQADAFIIDSGGASTVRTNMTASTTTAVWTGGYGTVPIFCNGVDDPFYLNTDTPGYLPLTGWPASYTCKMMRPFREFWVAGNITDTGTNYNQLIHWSSPAGPGSMPPNWDYADENQKSGRQDLADEGGSVVDAVTVGRVLFLYKEETTWAMSLIGGLAVMQIDPYMRNTGLFAANHASVLPDNNVFMAGPMGVVRHDTSGNIQPILKRRLQRWLDAQLDASNFRRGFVTRLPANKEIMYCFPSNGNSVCDMALVWNWEDDYAFIRDLPSATAGHHGPWDESGAIPSIDELTNPINTYTNLINRQVPVGLTNHSVYAAADDIYTMETEGAPFTQAATELVRTGMLMDTDPYTDVLVKSVTPYCTGSLGADLQISVGYQDTPEGVVTWGQTKTVTTSSLPKADFRVEGKIPCVRFRCEGEWSLYGYAVEYEPAGRRQR